jgi:hypothetical protein
VEKVGYFIDRLEIARVRPHKNGSLFRRQRPKAQNMPGHSGSNPYQYDFKP